MLRAVMSRLVVAVLVAVTVSVVGFSLLRLSGDLAAELAGEAATPAEIESMRVKHGLDRPLPLQFLDWTRALAKGDLGRSLFSNEPVAEMILQRLPVTLQLAVYALIVSIVLGIPLGMLAAMHPRSWIDRLSLVTAVLGQAVPSFWLALILIVVFGVMLRWTPISGSDTWAHFILPTATLAASALPGLMRLTRSGMLEALSTDYIRTARAKGLGERTLMAVHALPNALLPVLALAAVQLGTLLGGSVIVESVFALDGIGLLAYRSILRGDFPVVQSILIFVALVYTLLTLIADLANAFIDPRIRLG
ncbi:MAG: ABC transporter permease [Alphaproteobacteria bacterium]|nr:ABC transporter permease [Alphaproteobacteria bacterium]